MNSWNQNLPSGCSSDEIEKRFGDDSGDDDSCDLCGGDGWIMLSDAGPGEWGEDCFCEVDRPITCPQCKGNG